MSGSSGLSDPVSSPGVTPFLVTLADLAEADRQSALERFHLLQPHLEEDKSLTLVARQAGIPYRTTQRWVFLYRSFGLAALARKDGIMLLAATNRTRSQAATLMLAVLLFAARPLIVSAAPHKATLPLMVAAPIVVTPASA